MVTAAQFAQKHDQVKKKRGGMKHFYFHQHSARHSFEYNEGAQKIFFF